MTQEKPTFEDVHWADFNAQKIIERFPDEEEYVVQSGVTPSGIIHVGHLRELATMELMRRALEDKGKRTKFLFSWDSYDAFRKVPKTMPPEWEQYLGLPLTQVPMPDQKESYGDYFMQQGEEFLHLLNFPVKSLNESKLQTSGIYADKIREFLRAREKIRVVLDKYRDEPLTEDWFPLVLFSEKTGKDKTKILKYDEEYAITYECLETGFTNTIDFRKTPIVKLGFRLDFAMRWMFYGVNCEGGGKDYATKGSAWFTAYEILTEVFEVPGPVSVFHNFVGMKGVGGKISSSKGEGIVPQDLLKIYTKDLVMFLFAGTRPNAEFDISFDADVIKLYEDFDKLERLYYGLEEESNPKQLANKKRIYELSQIDEGEQGRKVQPELPYQPSVRHLTTVLQSNDFDMNKVLAHYKDELKTDFDKERLMLRAECMKNWLEMYAPDEMRFNIHSIIPVDQVENLTDNQKEVIREVVKQLDKYADPQALFSEFRTIISAHNMNTQDFFKMLYQLIIGKDKGPKLAEFMIENKEKIIPLLQGV